MAHEYRDILTAEQRLVVLQRLEAAPNQMLDIPRLRAALIEARHALSLDQLQALMNWLDEAGLLIRMGERIMVLKLTARGEDVARGLATHPGVAEVPR